MVKMKKDGVSFSMGKPLQSHILFRTAKAERVQQLTTKKTAALSCSSSKFTLLLF